MRKVENKFIIIGNTVGNKNNGPAGVIKGVIAGFNEIGYENYITVLKDDNSKKFIFKLIKVILCTENSVINVHTDGYIIPMMVLLLRIFNRKNRYYLTCHGVCAIERDFNIKIPLKNYLLERVLYRKFPNLICVSEMERKDVLKCYGRKDNVIVIENGTDAWKYVEMERSQYEKNIKIMSLCGTSKNKGFEEFCELIRYLKDNRIEVEADVFGTGNLLEFENRVKYYDVETEMKFNGYIDNKEQVYEKIKAHDILVCFSHYDTFNVAILEAIALGNICFCSDTCGASEIIREGKFYPIFEINKKNYDDLMKFIENKFEPLKVTSEKYKELKEKYSWKGIAKKYIELLNI